MEDDPKMTSRPEHEMICDECDRVLDDTSIHQGHCGNCKMIIICTNLYAPTEHTRPQFCGVPALPSMEVEGPILSSSKHYLTQIDSDRVHAVNEFDGEVSGGCIRRSQRMLRYAPFVTPTKQARRFPQKIDIWIYGWNGRRFLTLRASGLRS